MGIHTFKGMSVPGRAVATAELYAYPKAEIDVAPLYSTAVVAEDVNEGGAYWAQFTSAVAIPGAWYRLVLKSATGRTVGSTVLKSGGVFGELVETFPVPVLASGDYSTGTNLATALAGMTTLLSRLTASAGSVLQNLFYMITGADEDARFTALSLQFGPNGASSVWTEGDIVEVKAKLALLSMVQSVVVVPLGSYMCGRGDVERIFGATNTSKWADRENTENAGDIASQILWAISLADSHFRSALAASRWNMPQSGDMCPAILTYHVAAMVGVFLYENKGIHDYTPEGEGEHQLSIHRKRVSSFIIEVLSGTMNLAPLTYSVTSAGPEFIADLV